MNSVNELLELFTRQAALERAMRQPGGARVTEEQELLAVRRKLAKLPEAMGISSTSAADSPEAPKLGCGINP
jgi:transposase-like protein